MPHDVRAATAPFQVRRNAAHGLMKAVWRTMSWAVALAVVQGPAWAEQPVAADAGCYEPIKGGWRIRISSDGTAAGLDPGSRIGVVQDEARLHRRPLFPPADKTMVWDQAQLEKIRRCAFRPLVLAYNEPRFLFDFHSAGGLLGHLFIGLTSCEESKWFHDWSEIDISYIDGRMEYALRDPSFPEVVASLIAAPLADSAGLIVKVEVKGLGAEGSLTWAYGGASAFFTNYAMNAPEFRFAPQHCAKDRVRCADGGFTLSRAFDGSDAYMKEVFAVARALPDWQAEIRGGSSWEAQVGFGAPNAFADAPAGLVETTVWPSAPGAQRDCVAVQNAPFHGSSVEGYIVVGMGGNIEEAIKGPVRSWKAARARNTGIAGRIVTRTPDAYLDAAVPMMAFATEGTWGDLAILHGGWSWRYAYLGWRGWYGPTCYGWTDRVAESIQNHTTLGLVLEGPDAGALSSLLEHEPGVYYNMNEVFIDQVRQYFDYTNDLELMREIFPILEGIIAWQDKRLQPGNESLYENSLNTWISDSHWYIRGQCAQSSAYMLRAHTFLADLAERLGEDPARFIECAERIRRAMQEKLWMPDRGVFAEYLDTRGNRMLHPEPELPTIYHTAEFGAADDHQIAQMLEWVDTHLRSETTPGGGKLVWSSNWHPNRARSYTHSTYEMAYAEELNLALTNYLAGRADEAYALIRGTLCGIFNGPTPGGLACHALTDGRQRANDEFADAISMWGRTVVEGLFGILPKRPDGTVELTPQFPQDWHEAAINTPHFSYRWRRAPGEISIGWESPVETEVRLRIPIRTKNAASVRIPHGAVSSTVKSGQIGLDWVHIQTSSAREGEVEILFEPREKNAAQAPTVLRVTAPTPKLWSPPDLGEPDLGRWTLIELATTYNASVTEVLDKVSHAAQPPSLPASQVGSGYRNQHLTQYHGSRNRPISDTAWRKKVGPDGVAWTTDGIPFKTSKEGPNIAIVTLAGGFPGSLEFPVDAQGKTLYLMISGMTFPVQSHVVNLRISLRYADGSADHVELINPFTIGDCWSTWCGRYHDTPSNGFENIGGRTGPAGSAEVDDLTQPISVDTEAHLVPFTLKPGVKLTTVRVEAIANDVIFGVMGATLLI